MNNRNLEKFVQTDFTKRFCEKYNFSIKVVKGQLVFFNNCLVINIYGYTVEKILYFDFFSSDYKFYEDSDVLLNKVSSEENQKAGRKLGQFYRENNIKEGDKYNIKIKKK